MSDRAIYTIRRGADYTFVLASALGESTTGYTCTSKIKRLPGGSISNIPSGAIAATYTVTPFAGDATRGPGWNLSLSDTDTLSLEQGTYVADALIEVGSTDYITAPWLLEVVETVSHP